MASIPLPALHVQPPADPSEGIRNLLAMRQMMQQGQLTQQEIQARTIQNQQQQQALKDQQTILGLYQKHGGDLDKVVQAAPQAGVSPGAIQQLQLHAIDVKTKTQDLVAKQGTEAARQADLMLGAHDAVDKAPAEQRPQVYQEQVASLQKQGVDVSQLPPEYPGDEAFKLLGLTARAHSKNVEDALKVAQTGEATAKAGEATAQANKITAETNPDNPANPEFQKQKYLGILKDIKEGGLQAVTPERFKWAQAYELSQRKSESSSQSDTLGVVSNSTHTTQPSGLIGAIQGSKKGQVSAPGPQGGGSQPAAGSQSGGSTPKPQNVKDATVDLVGQYKYNPANLSRLLVKHPEILAAVTQKYPDWSQSNYNAANKAITDLAPSGKTGSQITSYNTFLRHAGALYDAVDSLDNSKYSDLLNKPMNWLAQHTGDSRVADFMAAMQPPMKEFQSFLLNNHAMHTEDVKDAHDLIDVNKTPQEIRAVLKRFAETGSARLSEQNESFKRVTGRDIPNLVSPEAAKAYNKIIGGNQGGGQAETRTYQGHTYTKQPDGSWKRQ